MKVLHRTALLAASLAVAAAPSVVAAQGRGQMPGPDTRKVLVTAFRGDTAGGARFADELRDRVAGEFSIRQLMPISKKDISATLVQSGYRPDSALSPNDIKELAKLVRADEVLDGTVTKTPTGYRVSARMFLPRDASLSQPLLTVESANLGDIAKQVVKEYEVARKQIADNSACENGIRANTLPVAIAAARKGMTTYPKATISRLCLASAYQGYKSTADSTGPWKDSVIAITREIIALDPVSRIAYQLQYDAYKSKNDTTAALKALVGLMNADPTNSTLREQVIAELVTSGKADIAIPTARQLVADNPGDPQYARTLWQVLRIAKNYKESVAAGVAYVAIDTAAADSGYFERQISDLAADSNFAKAAEMAATGAAKFGRNATLLVLKAQNERKAGQLPAAKASLERALQVDPKFPNVAPLLAQISFDLGAVDDAVNVLKSDVAANPDKKELNSSLLVSFAKKLYDAAAASKSAADYKKVIPLAKGSDDMFPNINAKFFMAVSAFQALAANSTELQKSKSCEDYRAAAALLEITSINMGPSGRVSPETAQQIMAAVPQFQAFIDGSIKRYCR